MRKQGILAVDVLSEVQVRVEGAIRELYEKHPDLTPEQETTLRNVYFGAVVKSVLGDYAQQGISVRGSGYIRTMADMAKVDLDMRRMRLDEGSNEPVFQSGDAELSERMSEELGVSMHVPSHGYSEEDFRFGMRPYGRQPTMERIGMSPDEMPSFVREPFSPKNKSLDEIMRTLPRKHKVQNQTYVLDVDATLRAANVDAGQYHHLKQFLDAERCDPKAQDELRRLYAEIELAQLEQAVGFEESDD